MVLVALATMGEAPQEGALVDCHRLHLVAMKAETVAEAMEAMAILPMMMAMVGGATKINHLVPLIEHRVVKNKKSWT